MEDMILYSTTLNNYLKLRLESLEHDLYSTTFNNYLGLRLEVLEHD